MFNQKSIVFLSTALVSFTLMAEQSPLETITVTGVKSQTPLQDQSSNLGWVDDAEIALISPIHINESMSRIAGTWVSRGNGQEHLTAIRSPVLTGAGSCGAFYMAEDGIALRAPGFCNSNQLFGVNSEQAARIEVVKGPGSVVYGANAVHGVINILSPDIVALADYGIALDLGPHDYGRLKIQGKTEAGNHQLGIYGMSDKDGGYKEESGYAQQKVNLLHQYTANRFSSRNRLSYTNLNQETAGFIQGFEAFKDPALKQSNPNPEAFRDSKSVRGYSENTWQLSNHSALTSTPYFRYHKMAFLQHFLPWKSLETNGHRSLGIKLNYTYQVENLSVTTGVDVDYTEGWLAETQAQPFSATIPQGSHYDYTVDATTISPFIEAYWQLSNATQLTLGARFEEVEYDYENHLADGSACAPGVEGCRFSRPENQRRSFQNWSSRIGYRHQLVPNHYWYGQLSQGFRPPQATELFRLQAGQTIADIASEELTALETGLRGEFQGSFGELFYDVTLYTMDKDNFIFQDTQRQVVSDGETAHDGIELSTRWQFTESWSLAFSGTLAEHQYKNNVNISRGVDIAGNQIDTAPRTSGNMRLLWQQDQQFTELEWVYLGSHYLDPANTAEYKGHHLLNFRAGMALSEHTHIAMRLLNLTDNDYAERADFAFGNYRYFVGEPRSVYFSIEYRR